VPAAALATAFGAVGLAAAVVLWTATAARVQTVRVDRKRARWVTALVDEPVFAHWAAGLLALLIAPFALLAAAISALLGWGASVSLALHGSYALGLIIGAWGAWGTRLWVRVRCVEIAIAGLSPAFDGYRVVQLSDLHVGSFAPLSRALGWARRANGLEPDLTVVTGDLVTSGTAFYDDVATAVGTLKARDGVFVSMGNHDQWDERRLITALERRGVIVLSNTWHRLERDGAALIVAGLGDRFSGQADLDKTLAERPIASPTVLLSHYPDYFAAAAEYGVDLVLSGHTHGGQIGLPVIGERYNIGTLIGQRSRGLHRSGNSVLYVNAGLGTTGPPFRLGVSPEIALLVLRAG
jgi:hypothetical protein